MPRRLTIGVFVCAAVAVATLAGTASSRTGAPAPARPLQTGIVEDDPFQGSEAAIAFRRARAAGISVGRLSLRWSNVAPTGDAKPTPFDPSDPADPSYNWTKFDRLVRMTVAAGIQPIVQVFDAPSWAEGKGGTGTGTYRPSPTELGRFARAAARRYSGTFRGLPRVRLWQAWDEPNASTYLTPQQTGGNVVSAAWYRSLVNAFADAVHAVHRDNTVIAGGLSPFTIDNTGTEAVGPLRFMRALLCVSSTGRSTCGARVRFDVWSTHPFTSGGPTHHASNPDDVSIGDLPEMRRVLTAAERQHKIVSTQSIRFWVTEFSWDTNPPDTYYTVPVSLIGRWVAEGLYRMWSAGVSLVVWLQLRDNPYPADPWQSGLYFRRGASLKTDRAKPSLAAFRFPFVAFLQPKGVLVWGRTPTSKPADVVIEARRSGGWRRLGVLRAGANGIFTGTMKRQDSRAFVRARLARGGASLPFSLTRPPDRFVLPFGGGGAGTTPPSR